MRKDVRKKYAFYVVRKKMLCVYYKIIGKEEREGKKYSRIRFSANKEAA
jgi:hypothetical protein